MPDRIHDNQIHKDSTPVDIVNLCACLENFFVLIENQKMYHISATKLFVVMYPVPCIMYHSVMNFTLHF
jgi:hypothetical protein